MVMKNSNKKQLITSVMSLGLSATMLMGTTLAWFTDSASTTINTIQAGTLDVALMMKQGNEWVSAEGKTLDFITNGNKLWEPGATFEIPELRIENNGNLALKFKLMVNGVVGNADLAEVIDVYLGETLEENKIGTLRELMNDSDGAAYGNLLAGTETNSYKLAFKMQEGAANEYQGQSISGISFTVLATQDTVEAEYDKFEYGKLTLDQVKSALNAGEGFAFGTDITVETDEIESSSYGKTGLNHTNGGVIDGNGKTLTVKGADSTWDSAIYTKGGTIKNLNVKGAFRGIFTGGLTSDLIIDNVTFNDVTYTFNADGEGVSDYKLKVKNSTLNGWTSYSNIFKSVSFTNCNFGEGRGYAFLRPYNPTTLTNCNFSTGFKLDASKTEGIILKNCTVDGVAITQENITTLLGTGAVNATVQN